MSYTMIATGRIRGSDVAIRRWPEPDRNGHTLQVCVDGAVYSPDDTVVPIYAVDATLDDRMAGDYAEVMTAAQIMAATEPVPPSTTGALPTPDPAQSCAEEIVFGFNLHFIKGGGIQPETIAAIIRRHFPPVDFSDGMGRMEAMGKGSWGGAAPESSEFAGHTPGPLVVADCGRDAVCHVYSINTKDDRHGRCEQVGTCYDEANANIFAAAPALLAERDALKAEVARLKGKLEGRIDDLHASEDDRAYYRTDNQRLREALEKIVTADTPITEDFRSDCLRIARAALDKVEVDPARES